MPSEATLPLVSSDMKQPSEQETGEHGILGIDVQMDITDEEFVGMNKNTHLEWGVDIDRCIIRTHIARYVARYYMYSYWISGKQVCCLKVNNYSVSKASYLKL